MPPAYFDTRFKLGLPLAELPESFAIITAHATTGEVWTAEDNNAANETLRAELERGGQLIGTITGYSPITQHAEPVMLRRWNSRRPARSESGSNRTRSTM